MCLDYRALTDTVKPHGLTTDPHRSQPKDPTMFAAQLTRTFVQPEDVTAVLSRIARGRVSDDASSAAVPAAVRVAGDVSRDWRIHRGLYVLENLQRSPVPALLDTAHIVDDESGDGAMFVALRADPGPTDVFNPFLYMSVGHFRSQHRVLAATAARRGQPRVENVDVLARVARYVAGESDTPIFTRRDVTGPVPQPWRGRRDWFAYDDTADANDPIWFSQPAPAGHDIAFDMVAGKLLVATVAVRPA